MSRYASRSRWPEDLRKKTIFFNRFFSSCHRSGRCHATRRAHSNCTWPWPPPFSSLLSALKIPDLRKNFVDIYLTGGSSKISDESRVFITFIAADQGEGAFFLFLFFCPLSFVSARGGAYFILRKNLATEPWNASTNGCPSEGKVMRTILLINISDLMNFSDY